jgi:hypothetical protein
MPSFWKQNYGREVYGSYKNLFILWFLYILGLATQIPGKKTLSCIHQVRSMLDKWSHTVVVVVVVVVTTTTVLVKHYSKTGL